MITLDEDMAGFDRRMVLVQGLKVCLGLFGKLNDGRLFGAHFTPGTPLQDMNTVLSVLRHQNVTWMAMASKFDRWQDAASGLTTPALQAQYFSAMLGYDGDVIYLDLQHAPHSYDVQYQHGMFPSLKWRATPDNPATIGDNRHDIWKLERTIDRDMARQGHRVDITRMHACDGAQTRFNHNNPTDLSGFHHISLQHAPVA